MATLPAYVKQSEARGYAAHKREDRRIHLEADPYKLRALPGEDVFFFSKRIDNSRVVREADPRARGACWSAAAMACLLAALLAGGLAPRVANTLAGYKLEALKQEQQRLIDERSVLEVEEARLLSPARLEELARRQNLVTPKPDQLIDLDPRGDGSSLASLAREKTHETADGRR